MRSYLYTGRKIRAPARLGEIRREKRADSASPHPGIAVEQSVEQLE
jgi:hypothetical protein